jgi:hypothetical protein
MDSEGIFHEIISAMHFLMRKMMLDVAFCCGFAPTWNEPN